MTTSTNSGLREQAIGVLRTNDHGGYTVPTATGLYPAQWNWDSCLVALGFAQFDPDRAWREIETLFDGQWPDGMVAQITFREDDSTYFPNSEIWQAGHNGTKTSGITQPPVAATVVRYLAERNDAPNVTERLKLLLPKLVAYHRWFYKARDPHGTGLVSIIHPWESGMDNSPIWDNALQNVEPGPSVQHLRKDIGFSHADMRPRGPDYDRYINLVIGYRELGYDPAKLYDKAPFLVADIGFNAILQRANRDLIALLRDAGEEEQAQEIEALAARTAAAMETCWDADDGFYYGRDVRLGATIRKQGIAGFLPLYADPDVAARHPELIRRAHEWLADVRYGMPSYRPNTPEFEPKRYWRGPIWLVVNWMLLNGLARNGAAELSGRILSDSLALVEQGGFGEYFDPTTGEALGGTSFSWTAAMILFFQSLK